MGALVAQAADALRGADRALVTVYHGQLDGTGHTFGASSDAWRYHLGHVDKLAEQLAAALPAGTPLYVTADHGMVDVGPDDRIDVDPLPALREGVALLGGEPRARHVYAEPGAAADVLAAWAEVIGDRAWVLPRDEAIGAGWFGPVPDALAARIGDVVAAPAGPFAIVATGRAAGVLAGRHARIAHVRRPARAAAAPCPAARPRAATARHGHAGYPQLTGENARVCGSSSTESWDYPQGEPAGNRGDALRCGYAGQAGRGPPEGARG